MPTIHDTFRLDFTFQILDRDESSGIVRFALQPNPERYEWITHNGERALFDRFDRYIIPERVLADATPDLFAGMPMTFAPPLIDDAIAYIDSRADQIARKLVGDIPDSCLADPSAEVLAELAGHDHEFAIISVDLVGSTRLSGTVPRADYARLVQTLLSELSEIAPLFHGHVLKYTGDGVLVYMPGPSSNQQNDLAVDCAFTMRGLVYRSLNPALEQAGLPPVEIRIGIDAGEAAVLILGSSATKRHADIVGEVVSLACKIEATAAAGEIRVGGVAAHAMHTHWRELLEPATPPNDWPYTDETGAAYALHRVNLGQPNGTPRCEVRS